MNATRACDVWLSLKKARAITGRSRRWIFGQQRAGKIESRETNAIVGNGRVAREYLLSSLGPGAEHRYFEQLSQSERAIVPAIPERLAATPVLSHDQNVRGIIPEKLRPRFEARFRVIEPLIEYDNAIKNGIAEAFEFEGVIVASRAELLSLLSNKHDKCAETIEDWCERYRSGEAALLRNIRADRGHSRFFEDHTIAAAFARAKYIGENLSVQMTWEALKREWKDIGEHGDPPGYNTLRRHLLKIPRVVNLLAREGEEAAIAKGTPSIVRRLPKANEFWVADHRVHDVFVHNTLFPEIGYGKAYRPWMTAVYDQGTKRLLGFVWAPTPSSRTINAAIRMGAIHVGLPRNFYWDNGRDFIAVGERMLSPELASFIQARGIGVTHALPKHPQSKPIESFFAGWAKRFDPLWGAAYCGSKPQLCSEFCRAAQKQHEKWRQGRCAETLLTSDVNFFEAALQFGQEYNAEPQKKLHGLSPDQLFNRDCPRSKREMVDARALDQLLWQRDRRVLQPGGCVELNNLRYEPTEESFAILSALPRGAAVSVARDPYDLSLAVAFDLESGSFIGELRMQRLVEMSANGRLSIDGIKANARRRHASMRAARLYVDGVRAIAVTNNWKPERERLIERSRGVRTGTDNRLLAAATPGAGESGAPPARATLPALAPAFVSDVRDDLGEFELED